MANTPATGNGPFEFTSANGSQISIPLTAFTFDANNNIVVDPAWETITQAQPGSTVLSFAVKEGLIAPAPVPSPFPAMTIRAADPGTGGNNISITVAVSSSTASPPTNDPTQVPFSITVTETDVYNGLTAATIESVLGSSAVTGSSPGLVQVVPDSVDLSGVPVATTGALAGSPAQLDVDGSGSPALVFTLVAKKSGADGTLTNVTVTPNTSSPPSSSPETFTLEATWTKTVNDITVSDLGALVSSELGYEITVSKPSSGAYSVPAAGVSQLSGGAAGTSASATLFTGQ
jgi:hypothetical protein